MVAIAKGYWLIWFYKGRNMKKDLVCDLGFEGKQDYYAWLKTYYCPNFLLTDIGIKKKWYIFSMAYQSKRCNNGLFGTVRKSCDYTKWSKSRNVNFQNFSLKCRIWITKANNLTKKVKLEENKSNCWKKMNRVFILWIMEWNWNSGGGNSKTWY